jgi:hypothetical protein
MATICVSIYLQIHAPVRLRLTVQTASSSAVANQLVANMSPDNPPIQQVPEVSTRDNVLIPSSRTPASSPLLVSISTMHRCSCPDSE